MKGYSVNLKVKRAIPLLLIFVMIIGLISMPASAAERTTGYYEDIPGRIDMDLIGRYDVDVNDPEGGLEIVAYNERNKTAYAVDGKNSVLIAVPISSLKSGKFTDLSTKGYQINLESEVESKVTGFEYGDITSVTISPDQTKVAVTILAKAYNRKGIVAIYPIDNSDDTLGPPSSVKVGIQPNMAVFADNNTILTADEGEPRMGYGVNSAGNVVEDPKGSVTIVDINCLTAKIVGFDSFDSKRNDLTVSGVLITKGQSPSFDFEPEYIAVSSDGSKAYIALQENNALAVLDIKSAAFTDVYALGFKDHSVKGNEIYIDGSAKTYKNLLSAYHPDGISIYENNGKTYILTANEGDAREWSPAVYPEDHEDKVTITDSEGNEVKKVVVIDCSTTDGLPEDKNVLAGGRSFSMFEMTDDGIKLAYDSGSDFEDLTMSFYPDRFNSSNDSLELDVTVGQIDDKVFAFVALERIGGVMAYDITNPAKVNFSNYINTRDFVAEDGIGGDSGPEGIAFVASAQSPTGNALLILGCEITGTMLVYELIVSPGDLTGKLVIIHTNDTHGGDVAVKGTSIGTAGIAQLVKDYEGAGAQVLLVSAGDAIQGDPLVNLSNGLNAIKFMNLAGYDLMVPGNHEYDFGYDNLLKLEETADFPFISANILDKATGEPVFDDSIIVETVIGKVGIFGLTSPETMTKASPENVALLKFLAGDGMFETARQQVEQLKKVGAKYIIAIAHLGIDEGSAPNSSVDLIENVEGIDVVIDGHSHSVLDGEKKNDTILTSAGTKLSHAGVVIIDDKNIESGLISAKDYHSVDQVVDIKIRMVAEEIDSKLSEVFAKTESYLDGNRAPGVRTQETNLGDYAADAILWSAQQAVSDKVDAAITNGGGIRASIKKGHVTMKDMKTVFPYGNTIATVKVTGAQLLEILEASTFSTPASLGAFPQVAGIEFTLNTSIPYINGEQYPDSTYFAPAKPGARITDVKIAGEALDLNKTYTVATNDFLAAGGDTYYLFKSLECYNTYVALEDALINYTKKVYDGVISEEKYGKPVGRITITNEPGTKEDPKESDVTYTVVKGDTLWSIAVKYFGDGTRYVELFELNKRIIKDPDVIYITQVLRIPVKK